MHGLANLVSSALFVKVGNASPRVHGLDKDGIDNRIFLAPNVVDENGQDLREVGLTDAVLHHGSPN